MTEVHTGAAALPPGGPWPVQSSTMPGVVAPRKSPPAAKTAGKPAKQIGLPAPILLSLKTPGAGLPAKKRAASQEPSRARPPRPFKKRSPMPQIHNTDNLDMLAALAAEDRDRSLKERDGAPPPSASGKPSPEKGAEKEKRPKVATTKPKGARSKTGTKRQTTIAAEPAAHGKPAATKLQAPAPALVEGGSKPPPAPVLPPSSTAQKPQVQPKQQPASVQTPASAPTLPVGTSPAVAWLPPTSEPLIMVPVGHTLPGVLGPHQNPWLQHFHLAAQSSGPRVVQPAVVPSGKAVVSGDNRAHETAKAEHNPSKKGKGVPSQPLSTPEAKTAETAPAQPAVSEQAPAKQAPTFHFIPNQTNPVHWIPAVSQPQELLVPAAWPHGAAGLTMIRNGNPAQALALPLGIHPGQMQIPIMHPPQPHLGAVPMTAIAKHNARAYRTQIRSQRRLKQGPGNHRAPSQLPQLKPIKAEPASAGPTTDPATAKQDLAQEPAIDALPATVTNQDTANTAQQPIKQATPAQAMPSPSAWATHMPAAFPHEFVFPAAWGPGNMALVRSAAPAPPVALPSGVHPNQVPLPFVNHQPLPPRCTTQPVAVVGQGQRHEGCKKPLSPASIKAKHDARAYRAQVRLKQRRLKHVS